MHSIALWELASALLFKLVEFGWNGFEDFVLAFELDTQCLDGAYLVGKFLLDLRETFWILPFVALDTLLKLRDLWLVLEFYVLEWIDEFLKDIDKVLSLLIILNPWALSPPIPIHLILELLPEIPILLDKHFKPLLNILMILIIVVIVVKILNWFGKFVIDLHDGCSTFIKSYSDCLRRVFYS